MLPRQLQPFPCPFCHSAQVRAAGGSQRFQQYRCAACSEIWTAMTAAPQPIGRPAAMPAAPAPRRL